MKLKQHISKSQLIIQKVNFLRSAISILARAESLEQEIKTRFGIFGADDSRFWFDCEWKWGTKDWKLNPGSQPQTRARAATNNAGYRTDCSWRSPSQD